MSEIKINNRQARHLWLHTQGLAYAPTGACNGDQAARLIESLGLLQQDPIRVVARAHDHILWSRCTQYRPSHLETLMHKQRGVFEHFSHDACLLPISTLPHWQRQFKRKAAQYQQPGWREGLLNKKGQAELIAQIADNGPQASKDFKQLQKVRPASGEIWSKPAHKRTLDYLWLKGELAVSHRKKFVKYYDLSANVYPQELVSVRRTDKQQIDWLCTSALKKLGFASVGEIMRFWDACSLTETRKWCDQNAKRLMKVQVESATGDYSEAYCFTDYTTMLSDPPEPTKRLRILNPFDPAIRDRKRMERLFNFEYRIEMYTPANKRQYGYYVYPLMEFDQIVGRLEVKHDRESNILVVDNLWLEPKVRQSQGRLSLLESELDRMRRFCGADALKINAY